MRRLLSFSLIAITTFTLITCSDSGTSPDPGNNGNETSTYNVSVDVTPSDAGSISPSANDSYEEGEEIELQANANDAYLFTGWTGDIESTENPLALTVDQDYNLTANFEVKNYDLTINTEGEGTVNEEVLEQKSKEYEHGTVVELTANPAEGYRFVEWQGDITGSDNPTQITVDNPKEVTAVFEKKSYELSVTTEGEGAVSEEVVQAKAKEYDHGTVVALTASPAEGWQFVEWQGAVTGSENPQQVTVDDPKEVTAVFEKKSFVLNITAEGEGSVNKEPSQEAYEYGTNVDLTAQPAEGWRFVEWQGAVTGSENSQQVTVDAEKSVTAVFEEKSFTLSVETSGEGSVSINPDQTEYEYGTEVELIASASGDWAFDKWQGDVTGSNNPVTITMDTNKSVTALFENTLFAGGSGTEANPYQISTIEQLQAINQYPSAHYVQVNNIDAIETKNWNDGRGFKPIGDEVINFTGSYNGQEFKIKNLTIHRYETSIGLFGYVDNANIKNVGLEELEIKASGTVGGLIGQNSSGRILNCYSTGKVSGKDDFFYVGGLIGINTNGNIINSHSSTIVTGNGGVGGLIGMNKGYESQIENSYFDGEVKGGGRGIGGLIGGMERGKVFDSYSMGIVEAYEQGANSIGGLIGSVNPHIRIENSYSKSTVLGGSNSDKVGGLVGYLAGVLTNSFAVGDVSGADQVGGLVGRLYGEVNSSYATGNIKGKNEVGGLIGISVNQAVIKKSYSIGKVGGEYSVGGLVGLNRDEANILESYTFGKVSGTTDVGGLIGTNGATIETSYWDTEATGQTNGVGRGSDDGVTGLTISEMTGAAAENNMSDFDWVETWVTTDSYPALFWEE